ncbi:hypothetical protein ACFLZN_01520 [Nanoarchaeota archaeon]
MKIITKFLLLVFLLSVIGCDTISIDGVTCNKPYIKVGKECCLDQNENSICDSDEVPKCGENEILVFGECCPDTNQNNQCDNIECGQKSFINGNCCWDTNENNVCDEEECGEGESLVDNECCEDLDKDFFCDLDCKNPEVQISDKCCLDSNKNNKCDDMECKGKEVLIAGNCCLDENNNFECDDEEAIKTECPEELYDREYRFFEGYGNEDMLMEDFYVAPYECAECFFGFELGQNNNYRYCEKIIYTQNALLDTGGNVIQEPRELYIELVLKEVRREEQEGPEYPQQPSVRGVCKPQFVQGTWVYYEPVEVNCEPYLPPTVIDDTPSTTTIVRDIAPRGGCPVGTCWSNGACCSTTQRYYCQFTKGCYSTQQAAMSDSNGRCTSFRIIC